MKYEAFVKPEGSSSYTKLGETIDDGNWEVPAQGTQNYNTLMTAINSTQEHVIDGKIKTVNQIWNIPAYSGIYMRTNKTTKGYLRNVSVKEISPLP